MLFQNWNGLVCIVGSKVGPHRSPQIGTSCIFLLDLCGMCVCVAHLSG